MSAKRIPLWLQGLAGVAVFLVGKALVHGWWSLVGVPAMMAGVLLAAPMFDRIRESTSLRARRVRLLAVTGVAALVVGAVAVVTALVLSPDSSCEDCGTRGEIVTIGLIDVFAIGFAVYFVWVNLRRERKLARGEDTP
jgi:hypothetical protein